jgi:hypothetical protein
MQQGLYNGRIAYLATDVEGSDRIWFLAEQLPEDECLPLIIQKRNNTLTVDNNSSSNGGYSFSYYKWYRNDMLIHEGAGGAGFGGIFNTGKTITLDPNDTYHVLATNLCGTVLRSCPYNPVIFVPHTEIITHPNPVTTHQPFVVVEVKTNDEELLANGVITAYNALGQQLSQTQVRGHRATAVQLPSQMGVYILRFVSGTFVETTRVVVIQ